MPVVGAVHCIVTEFLIEGLDINSTFITASENV
jgi:hypothetical protein